MCKFTNLTRNSLLAATLVTFPLFSQTDPNRPADMSTASRADERHDEGFDTGWLGLVGLAGLAGLRRKSPTVVTHTAGEGSGARVYPSNA